MSGFDGQVAIVTGGSRSIGRAISESLAAAGAHVAVNYATDAAAAEDTVASITAAGGTAVTIQANIADPAAARRLIDDARACLGPISLLVNNAAVLHRTPLLEIDPTEWDKTIATNLTGSFHVSQAAAQSMVRHRARGAIVTVSSINDRFARPGLAHYSASKGGVTMLTRQLALELAPYGIRANTVALGLIETDMNRERLASHDLREQSLDRIPLKMIGRPEDVAGPVLFLLSDDARMITGATLTVDAGRSLE